MSGPLVLPADREYVVEVVCPSCRQTGRVVLKLASRLDRTSKDAFLGLKVGAEKLEHICGQLIIDLRDISEALPFDDGAGDPE